jgi:uncharacterized protein YndB with AHSA1/START domain
MSNAAKADLKLIVIEYELKQGPEKVWKALTERALIEAWLMPNDFRAVLDHRFTFRTTPVPGWDGTVHCEVIAVVPPRLFSYTWRGGSPERKGYGGSLETVVRWTLTMRAGGATLLRLKHAGFTAENDSTYSILRRGWNGDKMRAAITRVTGSL